MTIGDAVAAFLEEKRLLGRLRPRSSATYAAHLEAFASFCGAGLPIEKAALKVSDYLLKRGEDLGDHAFAKAWGLTRALLDWARVDHALRGRRAPPIHDHARVFLSEGEVEKFLESVKGSGRLHAERDVALYAVCYYGLLRIGEATILKPGDVDTEAGEILVLGKGGRQRHVPMCRKLFLILAHWLKRLPPTACRLFPSQPAHWTATGTLDGCRMERVLREVYAPLAGLAGKMTPHTLRRSGADRLRRRGAPLTSIQHLLGHRRLETTMLYLGVSADELRSAVSLFDSPPARGGNVFHESDRNRLHYSRFFVK